MNEPDIGPAPKVLNLYCDFYNYAANALHARYPGVKLGCGGFNEWTYIQAVIDQCGKNLDWISRHPYGHTGEAIFYLQDQYARHARERGLPDMKFIITEWDFWIYGLPAFDYIMQPHGSRRSTMPIPAWARSITAGTSTRRGGYQFGIRGEGNKAGELPPDWPHPGRDQPITYRYDAFWAMRDCRGPQFPARRRWTCVRPQASRKAPTPMPSPLPTASSTTLSSITATRFSTWLPALPPRQDQSCT